MATLSALVNELETKIEHSEKLNNAVSNESVGWHVQHSLLVFWGIIQSVEKSNPAEYEYKFNLKKLLVFTLNKIPRGKAKAPDRVMPKEALNKDELKKEIHILKSRLDILNTLRPDNFFIHPVFGHLNIKATIKMLKIHTRHHLHIIDDIIKG